MSWLRRLKSLCNNLLKRRQVDRELDREVDAYYQILIDRYIARGLSEEEARRGLRTRLESPLMVKENVKEARMGARIETTFQDLRYGSRVLRKNPGFTIITVLTLALGIGANTAIFSLINAVMLRVLPVERADQLVLLTDPASAGAAVDTTEGGVRQNLSYIEFDRLRTDNMVFSGMLASQNQVSDLDLFPEGNHRAQSIKVRGQLVSGEFFQVLGVRPILGRVFTPEEDKVRGANPVAVISHDFWKRAFGGKPDVLGTNVAVGQGMFQIIGVAPPGFNGILVGTSADIWFPIAMQQQVMPGRDYLTPRDTLWLQVMARLAPGTGLKAAEAGINVTFQHALQDWASLLPAEQDRQEVLKERIELRPGDRGASALRGEFSDPLVLLMAMVGVVLLIACANIANLMLARANGRQREISVRLALGATRVRLIRQLMTESLLIALLGGVLGIVLAVAGTRLLLALVSAGVSDLGLDASVDYRVFGFTALISIFTGLLFGLVPAMRATRRTGSQSLATSGRALIGGSGRAYLGRALVVAQVALSLVLVIGAALFVRSLGNLLAENLGYDRSHLLMVGIDPKEAGYTGPAAAALYDKLLGGLRAIPGVSSATISNQRLFGGSDSGDDVSIEGSPVRDPDELNSRWTEIGPDYFSTLGIPLLRGREISRDDATLGRPVCVINQSFLKQFFPDMDPIGRHVTDEYPTTRETFEIIGVVGDFTEHRPGERRHPRFYANLAHPIGSVERVTLLLRSSVDAGDVASTARQAIAGVDANLPITRLLTVTDQIDVLLVMERLVAQLAAFFGIVALFMAAMGLYGVMSYSTSQRTSEIGIRMALGASGPKVVRMILGEALKVVAIGITIGLPVAFGAGKVIASKLYGLSAADPAAITIATIIIFSAALFAGYVPARRASRINPIASLKYE
jgi:predicted permease